MDFLCNYLLDVVGWIIAGLGGLFALFQWKKANDYKRADIVQALITKLRDEEDISFVMELIDWSKGLIYNGEFIISEDIKDKRIDNMGKDKLFSMIDKTLSHFSYICYLKKIGCLSQKDMYHFEYELRRLVDNEHIANYLYSLYHWSKSLHTECSFRYLIDYSLKNRLLIKKDFLSIKVPNRYDHFLQLPNKYVDLNRRHVCKK